jgi:hypothetical protein
MNPPPLGSPSRHYTAPVNTGQPVVAASPQTQHLHPDTLAFARLSPNAHRALNQTEAQPNGHHQLMGLLARNGIADGAMHLIPTQSTDAHYHQMVILPGNDVADLMVRAQLNGQAQYDIVGIDLHVPSSGRIESIALSAPPPVAQHPNARSGMNQEIRSGSSHLAAQYSRGQLTQALIRQNSPQNLSGAPLPSGASSSRGKNARVEDPEHPGQTISRAALSQRQQVPDPEHPGQTISRTALATRKYNRQKVEDPEHPGQTISRAVLSQRQQVPDPEHPGQTISRAALSQRQSRARAAARAAEAENA